MTATKQLRLSDPAAIRQKIKNFLGKRINIVLTDNRVVPGDLWEVDASGITIKNMRRKKFHYSFDQLSEIYFDTVV